MHQIEPFYNWLKLYDSSKDIRSPFRGKSYDYNSYSETIYGYYIDPAWDSFGSETLYMKLLFCDYECGFTIIEFIGEWNDALNNDIMLLKRNILEVLSMYGIHKYILIGENILNFHGSDDSYYEEWFEEVAEGWIACVNFPHFVRDEMATFGLDVYLNMGGTLEIPNWRTLKPTLFCDLLANLIQRRLN
ncbi:MAG: hypothetical protein HQ474_13180 [Flammeovirgaceae bacterium]|jgi:hypothetical protein|nr:hypothetical protein [Flammeovirgaceae bacterium]|tara:strand:+ start:9696 stop:10262 length:567 start_codon:yes stop_codon:yes gene_type:complete